LIDVWKEKGGMMAAVRGRGEFVDDESRRDDEGRRRMRSRWRRVWLRMT